MKAKNPLKSVCITTTTPSAKPAKKRIGRDINFEGGSPMEATWMPCTEYGELHNRAELPESVFAFPHQRKEPLTDADHVINALARFDQVQNVSDADRDLAFANIQKAAQYYGVKVHETDWRQLGG